MKESSGDEVRQKDGDVKDAKATDIQGPCENEGRYRTKTEKDVI